MTTTFFHMLMLHILYGVNSYRMCAYWISFQALVFTTVLIVKLAALKEKETMTFLWKLAEQQWCQWNCMLSHRICECAFQSYGVGNVIIIHKCRQCVDTSLSTSIYAQLSKVRRNSRKIAGSNQGKQKKVFQFMSPIYIHDVFFTNALSRRV